VLLVRPGSEGKVRRGEECTLVPGDIRDEEAIGAALESCDAAVYLVGAIREFPKKGITWRELHFRGARRVIDLAVERGARRFLHMSANGARPRGTEYMRTKWAAERYLQKTDLDWTIFRPSIAFGDPRGSTEFCTRLRDEMIRLPLPAPLFYEGILPRRAGAFRLAPVHVRDVTAIMAASLDDPTAVGKTYALCGPESFDWKTLVRMIAAASGTTKRLVPVPAWIVRAAAALLDRFSFFPITRDQIDMLMEGNTCESAGTNRLLRMKPIPFTLETLSYLAR
jgi:NADH dehydrogenase